MKNLSKISTMIVLSLLMAFGANAQPKSGAPQQKKMMYRQQSMLPDLTEAQQEQMKTIRLNSMKKMQPLKNSLMEKKARLHTLSTAEKADLKAINKQIDEIVSIQSSMQKIKAASKQEVRNLLTEDQRIIIESSAKQLANYFTATNDLVKVVARACGHNDIAKFNFNDLSTLNFEMHTFTGINYAGVN